MKTFLNIIGALVITFAITNLNLNAQPVERIVRTESSGSWRSVDEIRRDPRTPGQKMFAPGASLAQRESKSVRWSIDTGTSRVEKNFDYSKNPTFERDWQTGEDMIRTRTDNSGSHNVQVKEQVGIRGYNGEVIPFKKNRPTYVDPQELVRELEQRESQPEPEVQIEVRPAPAPGYKAPIWKRLKEKKQKTAAANQQRSMLTPPALPQLPQVGTLEDNGYRTSLQPPPIPQVFKLPEVKHK